MNDTQLATSAIACLLVLAALGWAFGLDPVLAVVIAAILTGLGLWRYKGST